MCILMFPGQGSQHRGMGEELFAEFSTECEQASNSLGYDIVDLCLHDADDRLNDTRYTQPAIYFVSALSFLKEKSVPSYLIGHSLGLYAALFAAEAFSLIQGLKIVDKRAQLMAAISNGSMMAVLGDNVADLDDLLVSLDFYDVDIANYNTDKQRVVSGKRDRLKALGDVLETHKFRVVPLQVSGAFHSRYMTPASIDFFDFLKKCTFGEFKHTILSSTTGEILRSTHLLEELAYQLVQPVRWQQLVSMLKKRSASFVFKEIGPGNVLTTLNHQIE